MAVRHRRAFPANATRRAHRTIEAGGEYQWRREGEYHLFNPETVFKLQHATRERRFDIFREYTQRVDDQSSRLGTLQGAVPAPHRSPATGASRRGRAGRRRSSSASPPAP